jgi:hypothetical protein
MLLLLDSPGNHEICCRTGSLQVNILSGSFEYVKLTFISRVSREDKAQRVKDIISSFSLSEQSSTLVGTPLKMV